jgi:4'-phosphopantetheinyl transferase
VDVEDLTRRELDGEGVGRMCFAEGERDAIEASDPDRRSEQRLALFTLKEAYSKARGLGLGLDFTQAIFALDPPALLTAPGDAPEHWLLAQRRLASAHVLAVAVGRLPSESISIRFFEGLPAGLRPA